MNSIFNPLHLTIFASGGGSNARAICTYFSAHKKIRVNLIVSNNPTAGVLQLAKERNIPTHITNRTEFKQSDRLLEKLNSHQTDYIALAGFLWLLPQPILDAYPHKILNIHPALLPKYGGKGMYGINVHRAVKAAKDPISGITIHLTDENYDKGKPLFQAKTRLNPNDTPEQIAAKVLLLEHKYYAPVLEAVMLGKPLPSPLETA